VVTDGTERVDPIGLACGLNWVVFVRADSPSLKHWSSPGFVDT
jgi:hypothetical protein